jgi:hypothetical protein
MCAQSEALTGCVLHADVCCTGGGMVWVNDIPVVPGTSYTVQVGSAGSGTGVAGGDSWFINTNVMVAKGGQGGTRVGGLGGSWTASASFNSKGGGSGGTGGQQSWIAGTGDIAGGGGGAGGYTGEKQ